MGPSRIQVLLFCLFLPASGGFFIIHPTKRQLFESRVACAAKRRRNRKQHARIQTTIPLLFTPEEAMPKAYPKLIVFDLDNTLWTPELYQLRRTPTAEKEIYLFEGARTILHNQARKRQPLDAKFAIASRTDRVDWAQSLLDEFQVDEDFSMRDVFHYIEIEPGTKKKHFERLRDASGVPYHQMMFFDDARAMNLNQVSQLGVYCVHCPEGMEDDNLFKAALVDYQELTIKDPDSQWRGYIEDKHSLGLT